MLLAAGSDPAEAFGYVLGTLVFPVLGIVLIVLGSRRRSDPQGRSRRSGTVLFVLGIVLLVLSLLGILGRIAASVPR